MEKKRKNPAKPAQKKKAAKKGYKGRDTKGNFTAGNKEAEKWTEQTVLPILEAMWATLTTDVDGQPPADKNVVRANDIKLLGEICLMHGVTKQRWNEWEDKFGPTLGDTKTPNPNFSEPVSDRIKNIRWLLECRLNYSAGVMDIFILKNHYEYRDQKHLDATTNGKEISNPFYELLKQTSSKP